MRIWLLIILCALLFNRGYSQSCSSPILVDFSAKADTSVSISGSRSGDCCTGTNCIVFSVTLNPGTDLINFTPGQITGSGYYTVNCGPLTPVGTPVCVFGLSVVTVSFCKPGKNTVNYTITASVGMKTSPDLNLRMGCTGSMSVTGLIPSTITWTSVYPGATGAYNSYLSQTSGVASVNVTPPVGAPAYIDYQVSGSESTTCTVTKSGTIRVYTSNAPTVTVTPSSSVICAGSSGVLTATVTGGLPPYTYLWSTGETTSSISVTAAGTYTVSVNDQAVNCSAITKQATVTVFTPVAPTAAATAICSGSTATLTATAPGGPYQWYDAASNGNLLSTNSSYTTPVLTANTTYYVQTTTGGCTSSRTPVTITVNPLPPKPGITSP